MIKTDVQVKVPILLKVWVILEKYKVNQELDIITIRVGSTNIFFSLSNGFFLPFLQIRIPTFSL